MYLRHAWLYRNLLSRTAGMQVLTFKILGIKVIVDVQPKVFMGEDEGNGFKLKKERF